jgi:hypothetical protein
VQAQDHVFILVDVSKSVKQHELNDAKQALNEILNGNQPSKAFISQGKQQDLSNFKIKQGDKLSISKFGNLNTTLGISPNPTTIQNINSDVNQVINSIVWVPTDGLTYITLAKAKIAEYAKDSNISKYKLYIISDNINDDYGPNGRPNYPDDGYTQNLVESYNTSTNPVNEAGYTKLKFSKTSDFTLSFSPSVDVSKYNLPPGRTPPPITDNNPNPVISISSAKGKKGKEYEFKKETFNLSWTCTHCPEGIKYTVNISEYDGGKFKETKKDLVANTLSVKLPDGKFRITVSASNYSVSSDTTFVKINTGSYGWLIFLLFLLVGGGIGYYFWNKRRQDKIENPTAIINKDNIFSKNNGTTNNSPNSKIF